MNPLRQCVLVLFAACSLCSGAFAQNGSATQPTAANPLRSPYDATHFFLSTVNDASRGDERWADAMAFLDLSGLDEDDRPVKGPAYARQLADIFDVLIRTQCFDPENKDRLPDTAEGREWSIGREPLVLVLQRLTRTEVDAETKEERAVREWKLNHYIVDEIPAWHARLDKIEQQLAQEDAAPTFTAVDTQKLRTPYHAVSFFLQTATAALSDGQQYVAAQECMDFTDALAAHVMEQEGLKSFDEVDPQLLVPTSETYQTWLNENGVAYVDGLREILQALLDENPDLLKKLPEEPNAERKPTYSLSHGALLATLVRRGPTPGVWIFNAQTVRHVPEMAATLKAPVAIDTGATPTVAANGDAIKSIAPTTTPPATSFERDETATPRQTLETFLSAMESGDVDTAVTCLDTSKLSDSDRELARVLAGKLWLVLVRQEKIYPQTLPDNPDAANVEPLLRRTEGRVELLKQAKGERAGEWLFSRATVRDIERLYRAVEDKPVHASWSDDVHTVPYTKLPSLFVREYLNSRINDRVVVELDPATNQEVKRTIEGPLPKWLANEVWGVRVWQWCGVAVVLVAGVLVRWISSILLPLFGRWLISTEGVAMLPRVIRKALLPCSTLLMIVSWGIGVWLLLDFGFYVMSWVWAVLRVLVSVVGVLAVYRIVDVVAAYFEGRASRTESRMDDVLVPLAQKTTKVVVVACGAIFIANTLGFNIGPLVAGLGIGGLAFSFAAKDTIANFFGSVNVVLDRPFQVGEWVKIGDVEGVVESVGLRSSRIRTFYKSLVTIPNGEIMNATVDNMGRRNLRRIRSMISVTYDTKPEALEAFTEGIRELIRRHPHTDKETYYCYVNQFAASSIDILLYCFLKVNDWGVELRERQRLFVDIIRLAERLGVDFAFPTQTLHMFKEEPNPTRMDHIPRATDGAWAAARQQAAAITDEFLPKETQDGKR